jgi:hypothetical protein
VRAGGSGSSSRTNMLVFDDSVVRALETVDVPEATFEEGADEVGEAVARVSHDHSQTPLHAQGT